MAWLFTARDLYALDLQIPNPLKMLPVLGADSKIAGKSCGRNEEVQVTDALSASAETCILLTPDSANPLINSH
ncbi:MAG: hypothetical protein HY334_01170 [Armatimonadetes bacterium]|nr:hypothetical protein [Armatimonadota bacterium]